MAGSLEDCPDDLQSPSKHHHHHHQHNYHHPHNQSFTPTPTRQQIRGHRNQHHKHHRSHKHRSHDSARHRNQDPQPPGEDIDGVKDEGEDPPPHEDDEEDDEDEEEYLEEYSGVSGDISLYQSGPLFSPLKEPPHLPPNTFSVDSLDTDSLHEDLILTCQANKDNYTIAFEGSFIQFSEDSDYHEAGKNLSLPQYQLSSFLSSIKTLVNIK